MKIHRKHGIAWKNDENGKITAIQFNHVPGSESPTIILGQEITSNGRICKQGLKGRVVHIREPYDGRSTSDVVGVDFFGDGESEMYLKLKDFNGWVNEKWPK